MTPAASLGRVGVVGAGMSGLVLARRLSDRGIEASVFDKARGTGGRMSTRRRDATAFDHGAQYFTVRGDDFARAVDSWEHTGLVAEWRGRIVAIRNGEIGPTRAPTRRFVGVPGMSAVTRHLASQCHITTSFEVAKVERDGNVLTLVARDGRVRGPFDAVVFATPAPQAAVLLEPAPALAARAESVGFSACWAVMLLFSQALPLEFDGAFVEDSPLSWVSRNTSKPGRPAGEGWVLHGSPEWSDTHLEDEPEAVTEQLTAAFAKAAGIALPAPIAGLSHRWRFAIPTEPLAEDCLFDPAARLGACGDWCGGPRVEGAFSSGAAMAERILQWAAQLPTPR